MTEARRGFFPFITGDQVSLKQGGAIALVAKNNLQMTQGGGQIIVLCSAPPRPSLSVCCWALS